MNLAQIAQAVIVHDAERLFSRGEVGERERGRERQRERERIFLWTCLSRHVH